MNQQLEAERLSLKEIAEACGGHCGSGRVIPALNNLVFIFIPGIPIRTKITIFTGLRYTF